MSGLSWESTIPVSYIREIFPQLADKVGPVMHALHDEYSRGELNAHTVSELRCKKRADSALLTRVLETAGVSSSDMHARLDGCAQNRQNIEAYLMVCAIVSTTLTMQFVFFSFPCDLFVLAAGDTSA